MNIFFFQIKWFASKGEYVAWYCIFITGNSKYDILVGIIRTALINKLKNSKDMEFTLVHKYQQWNRTPISSNASKYNPGYTSSPYDRMGGIVESRDLTTEFVIRVGDGVTEAVHNQKRQSGENQPQQHIQELKNTENTIKTV